MKQQNTQHVFIIGCKGIPARYGGFETFVDKLTEYRQHAGIQYHVACAGEPEAYSAGDGRGEHCINHEACAGEPETSTQAPARFRYHGADCVVFKWRRLGSARAIAYDVDALRYFIHYAQKKRIAHPVFYVLACRIGPFIGYFKRRIDALGGRLYINPDGHEFLRAKWSFPVRCYWKYSEKQMVKHAGLVICDSRNIQKYIRREYAGFHPKTAFIAYGAQTAPLPEKEQEKAEQKLSDWYAMHGLSAKGYYLAVGRFVPENNYETMLREFMQSDTQKAFVLVTDVDEKFLNRLRRRTGFDKDARIRFPGTVYDQELLRKIRENAYAYFHGHEVGGTNPSLLEALACTDLNLLLDIGFNREAAEDGACYWTKEKGNLAALIHRADRMGMDEIQSLAAKAHGRIAEYYSWEYITKRYERIFTCADI